MTASGVFKLFQGRKAQTQPQERPDSIA